VFSTPTERLRNGLGLSPDAREIYVSIYRPQSDIVLAKLSAGAP
jgi:hypothetical protein